MKQDLLKRFLKYVSIHTTSCEESNSKPSTSNQLELAKILQGELEELGLKNVVLTKSGIVYALLPANSKGIKPIGFIAHMDTSPEASGLNVKQNIIEKYNGKDIKLGQDKVLSVKQFPSLKRHIGKTIITTSGDTLLGADDKAGISEIMEMLVYFIKNKELFHGDIYVAFTPDEEIGGGIDDFDFSIFKAKFAYTVDGGEVEELAFENFNAASAEVTIKGLSVHPGDAKDKMVNSILIGMEFNSLLNVRERPENTENYEGFNHLIDIKGDTAETKMSYIIRNHDLSLLKKQKDEFLRAESFINEKYAKELVKVELKDSYFNMREIIEKDMTPVNVALEAIKKAGIEPVIKPIRGGTDGAKLTRLGLPTPNIGTGGYNYHGVYEYACLDEMDKVTEILVNIVKTVK